MKRHRKRRMNRQHKRDVQRRNRINFAARLAFCLFEAAVKRARDRINRQVVKQFAPGGISSPDIQVGESRIEGGEYIIPVRCCAMATMAPDNVLIPENDSDEPGPYWWQQGFTQFGIDYATGKDETVITETTIENGEIKKVKQL